MKSAVLVISYKHQMEQALSRQATEEVQLVEFTPVPQGQG